MQSCRCGEYIFKGRIYLIASQIFLIEQFNINFFLFFIDLKKTVLPLKINPSIKKQQNRIY